MAQILSVNSGHESVMAGLIAGLDIEFGEGAGASLAGRFWEAEACDFLWDARLCERWLGSLEHEDEAGEGEDETFDRVVILAAVDGRWVVAVLLMARRMCCSGNAGSKARCWPVRPMSRPTEKAVWMWRRSDIRRHLSRSMMLLDRGERTVRDGEAEGVEG